MNGKPPAAPQVPPSVQRARQHPQRPGKRGWTGLWRARISGRPGGARRRGHDGGQGRGDHADQDPPEGRHREYDGPLLGTANLSVQGGGAARTARGEKARRYHRAGAGGPAPPDDGDAAGAGGAETTQDDATVVKQGDKGAQSPRATPAPTVFISHAAPKDAVGEPSGPPTYVLAPGTFLPCAVETKMNSEVEGYFTAKVNQNVYDSATHARVLVPQGSTILGQDNSSQLVYGNERMDTISLTLTLPNGRSVELATRR